MYLGPDFCSEPNTPNQGNGRLLDKRAILTLEVGRRWEGMGREELGSH